MAEESTKHSVHLHEAAHVHEGAGKGAAKHEHEKKSSSLKIKPLYAAVVVLAIIVIIAGIYLATNTNQVVATGDTVNVSYTGTFTNGTVFDSNVGGQPLQFTVGSGQVIAGFDSAVVGMKVGDNKTITLQPAQAYGEVNAALMISVPANVFGNRTVEKGMQVSNPQNGQHGIITRVNKTNITIDFNPPLAGKTLVFAIKILSIKTG
ncbi:MAG: peptidylprolyl isomerase [Candidatus Micrarchaeota archaeon]|nr:peptidylprolyl isomerase [Candidatus Micrarchaeota archaeon]MDE1847683.1 peptidylprolyl isomerase [Candidatus Micrarchaeota archaeon]MDE1864504.1 peptidylprolyl isomerase [Candidatus Micrarchaeota archaeon]